MTIVYPYNQLSKDSIRKNSCKISKPLLTLFLFKEQGHEFL